jgi:protein-disulfide isomerase|tara:strand:+ start:5174 stop:5812 length:639 start_codon:yes stop_codon:yes gene_type:complete
LKKKITVNRRNTLLSLLAISVFPKFSYSNQDLLNDKMRKQFIGSDNAPIKIKEYFSLTCGHCANFHVKTLPKLKEQYIDTGTVQLEFIDYPLDRLAIIAAALARTLPTKDGYLEAISILLKKQKQWAYSKKPLDELLSIAKLFGVSSKQFDEILKNIPLMQEIINKMENESKNFNIESTPTFIINNDHKISGALSFKDFEKELLTLIKAKNS